jgi:hypothetical protein
VSECSLLSPLRRDGTSQRQRAPRALDPNYARVDERGTGDLLLYAGELATLLKYYNETNEPVGDWAEFIERDVSTLAARVGAVDTEARRRAFDAAAERARTADAAGFPAAFAELVSRVLDEARTFETWRRGAVDGLLLRARLDRLIEGVMADALQDTVRAARRARDLGAAAVPLPDTAAFGDVWGNLEPPADVTLFPAGTLDVDADREYAVGVVARAFERFHESMKRLASQASEFLADTLVSYPEHRPHAALFLAFLRLLNHARRSINTITARHLDFYYRDVLRLVPRPAVADRAHVLFDLAKNVLTFRVEEDTLLNAGKDARGVPLVYGTDDELIVNRAKVAALQTVFVELGPNGVVESLHAAPDADTADGVGAPLAPDQPGWLTFGGVTMPPARTGFALASPMLWLAEGTRTVTVRFALDPADDPLGDADQAEVESELKENVIVEASGAKGWIRPAVNHARLSSSGASRFVEYELELSGAEPPVVALDPTLHGESFDTRHPVLRFVMNPQGLPGYLYGRRSLDITEYSDARDGYHVDDLVLFEGKLYVAIQEMDRAGFHPSEHADYWAPIEFVNPYRYFERMRVRSLDLKVTVTDMRSLVLENDAGALNPAKPFLPFGPAPRAGSSFFVGSWEAFQKRLKNLTLKVKWAGLPQESFANHYAEYMPVGPNNSVNTTFTADLAVRLGGVWVPKASDTALFTESGNPVKPEIDKAFPRLTFNATVEDFPRNPRLAPIRRFDPALERGFLRLQLDRSFLHELFPAALAYYAANLPGDSSQPIPNAPYTPTISEVTLSYEAAETIDYALLTRAQAEDRVERLFQIGPFGQRETVPVPPEAAPPNVAIASTLVPRFTADADEDSASLAEGTLSVGLAGLVPPQNVSLLFQMAEGSEDPLLPAQDVQWSYLTAAGWVDFSTADVLQDTTGELIASGILELAIPKTATSTSTLLPAGLHWLRATVRRNSAAVPKAVAVHAQALQASFRDNGNDPAHTAVPLPAGTIAKLLSREARIKSVSQPYSSFGGRMHESDRAFRVRVAERLRHKRRAVTIFDYERLVLDRFPEVYKVRCLCHTGNDSEFEPGSVRVIVVPNLRNRNAVDPLRPRLALSRLAAIRDYLVEIASDFADIEVVNPDYEEVHARFKVRLKTGFDKGFYTGQLEQDIIRFLSPWLYDEAVDLTFGGRVHRSSILNFVDEREYVDFVTDFEIDHVIEDETKTNVEEAVATRSSAVIVPSRTHEIGDEIVACEDPPAAPAPPPAPGRPPRPPLPPGTLRYLGNVVHRELHDLLNITRMCQIDEIAIDRRFPFRRIEDAQALGYDFCAFCFPGRSRR